MTGQPGTRPLTLRACSHCAGGGGWHPGVWSGDSCVKLFYFFRERNELALMSVGAGGLAEVIYTLSITERG